MNEGTYEYPYRICTTCMNNAQVKRQATYVVGTKESDGRMQHFACDEHSQEPDIYSRQPIKEFFDDIIAYNMEDQLRGGKQSVSR